jgi:hypothetical protein
MFEAKEESSCGGADLDTVDLRESFLRRETPAESYNRLSQGVHDAMKF